MHGYISVSGSTKKEKGGSRINQRVVSGTEIVTYVRESFSTTETGDYVNRQ